MTIPVPPQTVLPTISAEELAERGWRTVIVPHPDGTTTFHHVPLTSEEFLHPEEDYHLPNDTFHDAIAGDAKDMLARRYAHDATVGIFRDLLIIWDDPALERHSPDVFVAFGVKDGETYRRRFVVADEGVRPSLIIEVVSPRYRTEDRTTKVEEYERAGVQEYVIVDRRRQRGQMVEEVIGYRLVGGRYRPIAPDEEGRILCRTVGLWLSLQEGQLVMEDAETGERLLTSRELEAAREAAEARAREEQAAREAAEARAREEQTAREAAEAEVADLKARLQALQEALGQPRFKT